MTRKDYEAFASMFRNHFRALAKNRESMVTYKKAAHDTTSLFMKQTADLFANDNPNFSRDRFYKACTTY